MASGDLLRVVKSGRMTASEYRMLHYWVQDELGVASECNNCDVNIRRFEWSNISGEYRRDVEDWESLSY